MAYTPQTWNDADPATPATAARVNHMEAGIEDADTRITALDANQGIYPLAGYGFHSATCAPESAAVQSTFSNLGWHLRVWVPPNQAITQVGMVVTFPGILVTSGLNGFAIYSDDGATKLGESENADDLWTVAGLRTVAMASTVAAVASGRFVRVVVNSTGYNGSSDIAQIAYALVAGGSPGAVLNGVAGGTRRTAFLSSLSSWPATIDPDTLGTATAYLPFLVLG